MSVYIIEHNIIFDLDVPSLSILGSLKVKTVISAAASRCLVMLIDAGGETVSREQLLHAGWGSIGQVVSDNSLNQAITQLRKVLKEMELQGELIMTVPRIGYKISRMFAIQRDSDESTSVPANVSSVITHHTRNELAVVKTTPNEHSEDALIVRRSLLTLLSTARPGLLFIVLIITSYALFFFTNKPVIQQMMTKFHTVSYLPITSKFNDLNVFFNDSIDQQGDYLKNAIGQFERDEWLHHKLGTEVRYIYINGSYNRDVFSYFLCHDEIQLHPENCRAYTSIQEGS